MISSSSSSSVTSLLTEVAVLVLRKGDGAAPNRLRSSHGCEYPSLLWTESFELCGEAESV